MRMSGLKAIEQIIQLPKLKLEKAADTRWLSREMACKTLVKVLLPVITSLCEATEREDALAHGLSKVVKHYYFVASLYMMCDQGVFRAGGWGAFAPLENLCPP